MGSPNACIWTTLQSSEARALRMGCAQYGIELMYRPLGKPHYGGMSSA